MKQKRRTDHRKGYNKPELEAEHPEIAAAFYYLLLKNKGKDPKFLNLWRNYIGRYKHHKTQTERRVHLTRILDELKAAGFEVSYTVKLNGQPIDPAAAFEHLTPDDMLLTYLGKENIKLASKRQNNLFHGKAYQIDDHFYAIVKDGEDWPVLKNPNKPPVLWQPQETVFNRFGYVILKAEAIPDHFFRSKQKIRY